MSKLVEALIIVGVMAIVSAQAYVNVSTYARISKVESRVKQLDTVMPQLIEAINVIITVLSPPRGHENM